MEASSTLSSQYLTDWMSTDLIENSTFFGIELTTPMLVEHVPTIALRETLKKELKWLFVLHTYGFACLFFVLAFYTFFSILNLRSLISSRPYMTTINMFICLLGSVRSTCLFIDPYNLRETLPRMLGSVLWDVGYPSVMAAFCFVQLAFLQLTQVRVGPSSMRNKSFLSLIITAHLCGVVGSDMMISFQDQLKIFKYVVHTLFLGWGIFLCCTFLCAGYKVMALLKLMPEEALLRGPPGSSHKGIMQLAMLAPYNNLASCLTAALMPTLLAPKIHISDETEQSSVVPNRSPVGLPLTPVVGNNIPHPDKLDLSFRGGRRRSRSTDGPGDGLEGLPNVVVRPPTPVAAMAPPLLPPTPGPGGAGGAVGRVPPGRTHSGALVGQENPKTARRLSNKNEAIRQKTDGRLPSSQTIADRRPSNVSQHSVRFSVDIEDASALPHSAANISTKDGATSPRCQKSNSEIEYADTVTESNCINSQITERVANDKLNSAEALESNKATGASKESTHSDGRGSKRKGKKEMSSDEEVMIELLPQRQPQTTDLTLDSILNHIAYVNRTSGQRQAGVGVGGGSDCKSQVRRVLRVAYTTAVLGLLLCVVELCQLYVPLGTAALLPSAHGAAAAHNSVWIWFCVQTLSRVLEFSMGCAMANITKQPASSRHQQHPFAYNMQAAGPHRESLYH